MSPSNETPAPPFRSASGVFMSAIRSTFWPVKVKSSKLRPCPLRTAGLIFRPFNVLPGAAAGKAQGCGRRPAAVRAHGKRLGAGEHQSGSGRVQARSEGAVDGTAVQDVARARANQAQALRRERARHRKRLRAGEDKPRFGRVDGRRDYAVVACGVVDLIDERGDGLGIADEMGGSDVPSAKVMLRSGVLEFENVTPLPPLSCEIGVLGVIAAALFIWLIRSPTVTGSVSEMSSAVPSAKVTVRSAGRWSRRRRPGRR